MYMPYKYPTDDLAGAPFPASYRLPPATEHRYDAGAVTAQDLINKQIMDIFDKRQMQ